MSKPREIETVTAVVDDYSRLFTFAAHELRTPASVVVGYLRMLLKDDEAAFSERHRALIAQAVKSCDRLIELIAEMSEAGKLDNNTAAVHTETFDLFSDLEEVAGRIGEGKDRDVLLELAGPSAGARMTGDRKRLVTAFGALFRAVLREQGLPVTIRAERRLVRDQGTPAAVVIIARESDVQRVYDATPQPFDERRGGMGLSLPIARRVIERAGGRLWAPRPESDDDHAMRSAAVVSLPLTE